MSLKFDDIMKRFYSDPKLGMQNEDAPANAVAHGGVDLSPDAQMAKKKKKNPYDGRTKEARAFYKRMETLKQRRESRLAKKVQESTLSQASYFAEVDGVINQVLEYVDNVELIKERLTNEQILERKSFNSNHKILTIVYMNLQDIFDVLDLTHSFFNMIVANEKINKRT